MAKISPLMILPPLVFVGFAALVFVGLMREDRDVLKSTFIGQPAPAVTPRPIASLPTFSSVDLQEPGLKLVNFWASWCAPCRAEHPTLIKLAEELPIYGINQDRTEQNAIGFLEELGNPFVATLFDETKRQSIDWGVYGLPETFLIDGDGIVRLRIVGPLTNRVMVDKLRPAMAEAMATPPSSSSSED